MSMDENPLLFGLDLAREPAPFTIVIFGASGDLTRRKLIPALFSLFRHGFIVNFKIAGFSRRNWSDEKFREEISAILEQTYRDRLNQELKEAFLHKISYISSPFEAGEGYRRIKENYSEPANKIYYLATPPSEYEVIIDQLGEAGLARPQAAGSNRACFTRLIIEKPFGRDLESARALNRKLASVFKEEQVYRIDHYLGKETVQNVMVFRFGNCVFEPIWNNRYIDHVQITMAETLGVGSRGGYYEKAGALKDIVQNHLLQLLCLVAMEPPNDLDPDSIRNEKVKVLKSIRPVTEERIRSETSRGQYLAGIIDGKKVAAYREEPGVSEDSVTETFVALRLALDSWRWAGVPFFLRTGKRLARRTTEISIRLKRPPHLLFEGSEISSSLANTLIMRIQPNEGMMLNFNSKIPGFTTEMRPVNMDFSYGSSFGDEPPEAYERLLIDAMLGDSTLYTRSDEIEAAWSYITGILSAWAESEGDGLFFYPAGSSGPEEAKNLLNGPEQRWRKL